MSDRPVYRYIIAQVTDHGEGLKVHDIHVCLHKDADLALNQWVTSTDLRPLLGSPASGLAHVAFVAIPTRTIAAVGYHRHDLQTFPITFTGLDDDKLSWGRLNDVSILRH